MDQALSAVSTQLRDGSRGSHKAIGHKPQTEHSPVLFLGGGVMNHKHTAHCMPCPWTTHALLVHHKAGRRSPYTPRPSTSVSPQPPICTAYTPCRQLLFPNVSTSRMHCLHPPAASFCFPSTSHMHCIAPTACLPQFCSRLSCLAMHPLTWVPSATSCKHQHASWTCFRRTPPCASLSHLTLAECAHEHDF